jgi:acetyl-CoA carboxylase biotin carboxyl carrier protein
MMEKIEATVTGRVLEILVQVGSKINVGDDVAKIESMKMEIPVSTEYAGTVTAVAI